MHRPLKTFPRRLDLSGLNRDEFSARVEETLTVKRARFPHAYANSGAREGVEQRVAAEMRGELAADNK
jgi:hypothetical protein